MTIYCVPFIYDSDVHLLIFDRECLRDHILTFRDADVLCPCNQEFDCKGTVTELEMRAVCIFYYFVYICM